MVFIAYNPGAMRHDMRGHPETALRQQAILEALASDAATRDLPRLVPDTPIAEAEALKTHTKRLWLNLETLPGPAFIDPDTYVVPGSFEAARSTARLCVQAVDRCLRQEEAGFVVARPPGHHTTRDRSMGFCLFNNVAIAAQYALDRGKRVLVFDHDVHHGNGTQEIFYASDSVMYQSFHLSHHYPGTGRVDEIGTKEASGCMVNAPVPAMTGEPEIRSLLQNVFVPIAQEFQPHVILVSAGFDSLEGDPLGGMRLREPFFGEIVARLRQVTPNVVCVLEGGYQLDRIGGAAVSEVHAMLYPEARGEETKAPAVEAELKRALSAHWSLK